MNIYLKLCQKKKNVGVFFSIFPAKNPKCWGVFSGFSSENEPFGIACKPDQYHTPLYQYTPIRGDTPGCGKRLIILYSFMLDWELG